MPAKKSTPPKRAVKKAPASALTVRRTAAARKANAPTRRVASTQRPVPTLSAKVGVNELAATQPLATVKARLSEFVDRVHTYRERITITRNGVPVAVIVDPDELFSIEETLDLMSDPEAMEALGEARSGEPMTGDEFVARMERAFGARPR